MTSDELKAACKTVMKEHLDSKGYLDMSDQEIMNELPEMWKLLEEKDLMDEIKAQGYNYQKFVQAAQQAVTQVHMEEELRNMFGFTFKRR